MQIRDMRPEDLEAVEELEICSFSEPWSIDAFRSGLDMPIQRSIVVCEDGKLAGYALMIYVLDEGQLINIAVEPSMRRRGFAAAMIEELIATGCERGATFFTLEVREHNEPAKTLYTKLGFREVGKRKNYYSSPVEDAILMNLELT